MKDFVKMFAASLLAIVCLGVFAVGMMGMLGLAATSHKPKVEKGSILTIDVYGEILEFNPPEDIVTDVLGGEPETLTRILSNLQKAAIDDRIEGVILTLSARNSLGVGAMEEIREAVKKIRESGKKVYAFSDDIDRRTLFLASACDSIFIPPSADMTFTGMGMMTMYVRGLLDKLDIHPNIHRIAEYKSAAEPVLRQSMSPETREMYGWLLDEFWQAQMGAIAEERDISMEDLNHLMDRAMFTASEAKDAGLVDDVLYWDQLKDRLTPPDKDELVTVSSPAYADVTPASLGLKGKKKIAVVHAQGSIGGRSNRVDPMLGLVMGHESINRELKKARDDDNVAAVVIRIDSGGGESLASDLIGHEVEVVAAKKPIVVSMADVAASGGYSMAYRATKIVADPSTITGSIGSINGKMNVAGMYNKVGITFDSVSRGSNTFLWSPMTDFTAEQRTRVEDNHWKGFNIWLEGISQHRGIDMEKLKSLAMGRVWTGRQAVENGLVDELGGLDRSIQVAKELAGIPEDESVTVVHYPRKKGLFELLASGEGFRGAVNWMIYKFIREDVVQSLELLMQSSPGLVR